MALMAVCSEMCPGLQVSHCDTGQCAPTSQPEQPWYRHHTALDICHILFHQDQQKKFLEFLVVTFDQNKFLNIICSKSCWDTTSKVLFPFCAAAAPRRCRASNCMDEDVGGTDLWSWLTFIMVLPMLAVIKRYFLMMSANFRQPPTKCLVANTHYKWYIYQEFKSHLYL